MDHLPCPPDSALIEVPFLVNQRYDGEDFYQYPERRGGDLSSWRRDLQLANDSLHEFDLCHGRSMNELLPVMQTWLCLGLLQCYLGATVNHDDFKFTNTNGREIWTNRNLESHLQVFANKCAQLDGSGREAMYTTNLEFCNEACRISSILDSYARLMAQEYPHVPVTGLQEQIFLVNMLQDALCATIRNILRLGVWHGLRDRHTGMGSMPSLLETYFGRANWCPNTIDNLKLHFDEGLQGYAFALGTVRTLRNHDACSKARCVANQLSQSGTAAHRDAQCRCSDVSISITDIVRILQNGQIPVFNIVHKSVHGGLIELQVKPLEAGMPYLAVSHVWSDGLASPLANKLPVCQLKYLRHVVDLILGYKPNAKDQSYALEGLEDVPIWFDGLCIPVQAGFQSLRDFSISKMRDIYDNAAGVMVLDPDLQKLRNTATETEILTRLFLSGWASRLWNLQEGALPFDLFLAGEHCVFNLIDFRRDHRKLFTGDDKLGTCLIPPLRSRLLRSIILPTAALQHRPGRSYQRLIAAISTRSTSRLNDETVVLASFLGLDTSKLLLEPDRMKRMILFMQMLPFIPASIIFAHGPRVCIESSPTDYGSLPETLLSRYGVGDLIIDEENKIPDPTRPGEFCDRPESYINPGAEGGLATFMPGITIFPTDQDVSRTFFIVDTPAVSFRTHDDEYIDPLDRTKDKGRWRPWMLRIPGLRSAIIFSAFNTSEMRREPVLLVHYTLHPETDTECTGPCQKTFWKVFVGRMVTVTSYNVSLSTSTHWILKTEPNTSQYMQTRGTLMAPIWWLMNPFPASHEAEKKACLTMTPAQARARGLS